MWKCCQYRIRTSDFVPSGVEHVSCISLWGWSLFLTKTWSRINCNWETKADFLLKEWPRGKKSSSGFSYLLSQQLFQKHFLKTLLWSQISSFTLSHILLILLVSSLSNQTPEKSFFADRCVTIRLRAFKCKQVLFELQLTVIHFELEMAS